MMTIEKFHDILLNLQLAMNMMIFTALVCILISISNTNKCLNKVNEKVGADIQCKTNFTGFVKCVVK